MPKHRKKKRRDVSDEDGFSSIDSFDDEFGAIPHREDDDPDDSFANDPFAPDYSDDHPFRTYARERDARMSGAGVPLGDEPLPEHVDSLANAKANSGMEDEDLPTLEAAAAARSSGTRHTGALADDFDSQLDNAFGEHGSLGELSEQIDAGWDQVLGTTGQVDDIQSSMDDQSSRDRIKRAISILICVALAIVAVLAVLVFRAGSQSSSSSESLDLVNDKASNSSSPTTASIPNMVDMFGKTTDEVLAQLGDGASLGSSESDDSSQGIVIRFASTEEGSTENSSAKLYLVEDSSGRVNQVSYSVDLDDLGYTNDSFISVITDSGFVSSVLKSAGCDSASVSLQAPDPASYQTMGTNSLGVQYVEKEQYTLSGATNKSTPSQWQMAVTFDHSVVAMTHSAKGLTRTMSITLS